MATHLVSWNVARAKACWEDLLAMDVDVALLQEAAPPATALPPRVEIDPSPWRTAGAGPERRWKAAVVKLSNRVSVEWIEAKPVSEAGAGDFCASRPGTIAAALVTPSRGLPFIAVTLYAAWESLHRSTGSRWIWADGSAHRLVSDLSALVGHPSRCRIVAAGDLNVLHGHGEHGDRYAAGRYATVFERMAALGLAFVGPQLPHGREAAPWPPELPAGSRNTPTFRHSRQTPATATRQLDFVFASEAMARTVRVRALNGVREWGRSDHCRVAISVD